MRRSRVSILNLERDPTLISQECVGASITKTTDDERKNNVNYCARNNVQSCVSESMPCVSGMRKHYTNDVLRRKAGSYLMAAKGLLNKVSRIESHFIQLT